MPNLARLIAPHSRSRRPARHQAQANSRAATAFRLTADAAVLLSNNAPGNETRAFQELAAAHTLAPGEQLDALVERVAAGAGAGGTPGELCAKLTANMSRKQWSDWVSPQISYITMCPGLPIPAD
jgi:hypothetical protein